MSVRIDIGGHDARFQNMGITGSAGIMPQGFGDRLSDEQIQAIIEYIKSAK